MNQPASPILSVQHLRKSYGAKEVLRDVSFDAYEKDFICIVGPSGAGKTTLLRCISQLGAPDQGVVMLDGVVVTAPPARMSVVFQDYSRSLLPWMRVGANIELPLRRLRLSKAKRRERVVQALRDVGLPDAENLYPWQMSGGMQQRAAIARSLAYHPEVLVMDEPFASVDAQTRADLEDLILSIRNRLGVTVVLVTHDIEEAVYLADRVVVLSGSPATVTSLIEVPLGTDRDQLTTKARPDYLQLRARIHELITRRVEPAESA